MLFVAANTDSELIVHFRKHVLRLTQKEMAYRLGVTVDRYKNWEYGHEPPAEFMDKLRKMGYTGTMQEVSAPLIPAPQLLVPIPSVGQVNTSSEVDWTDPFMSDTFEEVPPEMAEEKGRFAAIVIGDSMFDLLMPGDVVVFQRSDIPKIGAVVMFRSFDNRVTIKTLKHDGIKTYILHPENKAYEDCEAKGSMVGYLVGIIRRQGSRRISIYDPYGINP